MAVGLTLTLLAYYELSLLHSSTKFIRRVKKNKYDTSGFALIVVESKTIVEFRFLSRCNLFRFIININMDATSMYIFRIYLIAKVAVWLFEIWYYFETTIVLFISIENCFATIMNLPIEKQLTCVNSSVRSHGSTLLVLRSTTYNMY